MKIGAIISVSNPAENLSTAVSRSSVVARMANYQLDILGKSLLDRTLDKLWQFGAEHCTVVSHDDGAMEPAYPRESWEQAVAAYVRDGMHLLLFLNVNNYIDLNYTNLLEFRQQAGSPLSRVYAEDGALDVALVDALHLRNWHGLYRDAVSTLNRHGRFHYQGYVNRLTSPRHWYSLVSDGLHGRCGLLPCGRQTAEHVWQGEGCELDESVRITGPAFIGAGTRLAAHCVIEPGTAIEHGCELDCGTTVQQSWIQQNTYVGVALDVRHSLAANGLLFNLERNVQVNVAETQLLGPASSSTSFLAGLGSLIWDSNSTREFHNA